MKWALAIILIMAAAVGCLSVGEPTPKEKKQLAEWSAVVTEKDRQEVRREADRHTDWMERKKVQWMIGEYRSRDAKARAAARKRAATQTSRDAN